MVGWRQGQHDMEIPAAMAAPPILAASCSEQIIIFAAAASCPASGLMWRLSRGLASCAACGEQVDAAGWLVCGVQTCRSRRVSALQVMLQVLPNCLEEAVRLMWARCCTLLTQMSSWHNRGGITIEQPAYCTWPSLCSEGQGRGVGVYCGPRSGSGCHLTPCACDKHTPWQ